jgi:mevalonate kinase
MAKHIPVNRQRYSSKLLLFGEYTVLAGSKSLAVPFRDFTLEFGSNGEDNFRNIVRDFYDYLIRQDFSGFSVDFHAEKYRSFFTRGNHLSSGIPVGYGLGSSGAVTAAIFEWFFSQPDKKLSLVELKKILAQIENFFHGQSSGMDPLIIYLERPIVSFPDGRVETFSFLPDLFGDWKPLLIDSGKPRSTARFVNIFREKMKQERFRNTYVEPLVELNNQIIDSFIQQQPARELDTLIEKISNIQFKAFSEMIPENIRGAWQNCLQTEDHRIKLCGAGGGGFFLLFSKDPDSILQRFPELHPIHIDL